MFNPNCEPLARTLKAQNPNLEVGYCQYGVFVHVDGVDYCAYATTIINDKLVSQIEPDGQIRTTVHHVHNAVATIWIGTEDVKEIRLQLS